ncbi:DUF417 family protein [Bergeyella cardium]|uniref:DUF417 family protein n=1 Tax=Bergeyella cardium TaxID=1585976 RepID=A0A6P1QXF7_9FLAO|nr:DUF417 family protein [Bergeyella cardium]QHN65561.1 DUF417 family protein [Bergeyella cardium]WHE33145.1 DUF417 family protein [Bergeyella cardium]WHF59795.1 DUF417 family protein [Bergeyella cardium]
MTKRLNNKISQTGFYIQIFAASLILLWIGIFKFTPSEAKAIQDLVENHFITFWVYEKFSLQTVSNIIGIIEISIALLLLLGFTFRKLWNIAGAGMLILFSITLSYLFTTPNTFRMVDNIPITDFFILKDLCYLGLGAVLLGYSNNK